MNKEDYTNENESGRKKRPKSETGQHQPTHLSNSTLESRKSGKNNFKSSQFKIKHMYIYRYVPWGL